MRRSRPTTPCGDRDRSYAIEDPPAMTRRIPDARLCVLPECAHAAHLEKAELFTGALAGFLLEAARS
jgi:2-hydroxy-6-oxonona-2,4-dienedioate hydrolase